PLIAPLYGGRTAHEMLSALHDAGPRSSYDIVRSFWMSRSNLSQAPQAAAKTAPPAPARGNSAATESAGAARGGPAPLSPFDHEWRRWLHAGVVPNTAFATKTVAIKGAIPAAPAAAGA